MRRKAYTLAETADELRVKTTEFQGSILDGFDLRRTLRSYYARKPKLYVTQRIPTPGIAVDRNEPIVWIYNTRVHYVDGRNGTSPFPTQVSATEPSTSPTGT